MQRTYLTLLFLLVWAAGCQFVPSKGVELSSEPPGARVYIDGEDSGFVTPTCLGIDDSNHTVEMELAGYRTETRLVTDGGYNYLIYWNEAYLSYNTWRFPLWLNWKDGLLPWKIVSASSPGRIFVRMRRAQED